MTRDFLKLRRIAAMSAAIALIASPAAWAQAPASATPDAPSANGSLLSPAAFARLAGGPWKGDAPVPAPQASPRTDLLRQGTAAATSQARAVRAPTTPQSSGGWGTKTVAAVIIVGSVVGVLAASYYTGVDFTPFLNFLSGGK